MESGSEVRQHERVQRGGAFERHTKNKWVGGGIRMKTRNNLRAADGRQASHKNRHEKRRGALEHTRPFVSVSSNSPASKDQSPCKP